MKPHKVYKPDGTVDGAVTLDRWGEMKYILPMVSGHISRKLELVSDGDERRSLIVRLAQVTTQLSLLDSPYGILPEFHLTPIESEAALQKLADSAHNPSPTENSNVTRFRVVLAAEMASNMGFVHLSEHVRDMPVNFIFPEQYEPKEQLPDPACT
jgi:hypothetical protein